jgi:plasmid replication initiation protein
MTDKSLVVQHNKIIEAKYRLSVGEQRLIKLLVSMIEPDDEDFKTYRIAVKDLIGLLGLSDKDFYGKVKAWSKKLIGNVLIFRGEGEEELQVAWLSSAKYKPKAGYVELEFSPKLKPFLLHLKGHFTSYELGNIIRLKHVYSIRIYELLKQREKIGRRKFTVEELRELLMMEDEEYKQFCDFRRWVLKPAQKELAEKTDIYFTWEEERKRQKCVAIEFIIKSQRRPKTGFLIEDSTKYSEVLEEQPENQMVSRLADFGVTRKAAEELVKEYDEERINAALAYAHVLQRDGKLNNPAGFVVEAIKNKYRDNQAEERERLEKTEKEAKVQEEKMKRWEGIKTSYASARKVAFDMWYASLSEEEIRESRETYMQNLPPILLGRKGKNGMVERMFLSSLESGLAFPTLREWAQQSRLDVTEFEEELRREEGQSQVSAPISPETAA